MGQPLRLIPVRRYGSESIRKAYEGRTGFIVASFINDQNADIILVMKDGNIIEQGSHESLLAQNGFYANL